MISEVLLNFDFILEKHFIYISEKIGRPESLRVPPHNANFQNLADDVDSYTPARNSPETPPVHIQVANLCDLDVHTKRHIS